MVTSKFLIFFLKKEDQDSIENKEDLKTVLTKEVVIPFKDGVQSFYVNYAIFREPQELLYSKRAASIIVEVEISRTNTGDLALMVRHPCVNSDIDLSDVDHFYIIDNNQRMLHDLKDPYKEKLGQIAQRVDAYFLKETISKLNEQNILKLQQCNKLILKEI